MKQTNAWDETSEVDDLPVSSAVTVLRPSRYGGVAGLPDDELADPAELEQQAIASEWGPVLSLPVRGMKDAFRPSVDESGMVEGAFGSVDFDRVGPEFDKARYKADRLMEKLHDLLILVGIVKERLPGRAKGLVLRYVARGTIQLDDIASEDMRMFAQLVLRAKRLQEEIAELRKASLTRRQRQAMAWLEA